MAGFVPSPAQASRAAVEAARALLQAGNLTGASQALREVLRDDIDNVDALGLLALSERRRGHVREGLDAARAAVRAGPESGWARGVLGLLLEASRDPKAAAATYAEAESLDPALGWVVARRGRLLAQRGTLAASAALLREGHRRLPFDDDVAIALADVAMDAGDLDEAGSLLHAVLERAPEHEEARVSLGFLALRRHRKEEATELALWVLAQDAENEDAIRLLCLARAARHPLLALWLRWAHWVTRFGARGRWLAPVGSWFGARLVLCGIVLIPHIGPPLAMIAILLWILFCILTWVAPWRLKRMVKREQKRVRLRAAF